MSICDIAKEFIPMDRTPPRVLVIEDDLSILLVLKRSFAQWEMDVHTASSYAEVDVEVSEPGRFDLVVLDLVIPGSNRADMMRLVADKTCCPVMVYSGNIDEQSMHAAINILDRPVWFIQKPAQFTRERIERIFRMANLDLKPKRHAVVEK